MKAHNGLLFWYCFKKNTKIQKYKYVCNLTLLCGKRRAVAQPTSAIRLKNGKLSIWKD